MASRKAEKQMRSPLQQIFNWMEDGDKVQIWLQDNHDMRLEGYIKGFDEYINLTIDRCEEVYTKDNKRRAVGRVLLKGENVSLFVSLGQDDDK